MEFNVDQLTFPLRWHGRLVMKAGMGSMEESVARVFLSLGVTEGAPFFSLNFQFLTLTLLFSFIPPIS